MTEYTEQWALDFDRPAAAHGKVQNALDMSQAIEYLFPNPDAGTTLRWGSREIKIKYAYGVSDILGDVLNMLEALEDEEGEYFFGFTMNEPDGLDADWRLNWKGDRLIVEADWRNVPGGIDAALRLSSRLQVSRRHFRESWVKLLLFLVESAREIRLTHEDEVHKMAGIIERVDK
jgi:hypothetical protein